jgi:hypothetical protein
VHVASTPRCPVTRVRPSALFLVTQEAQEKRLQEQKRQVAEAERQAKKRAVVAQYRRERELEAAMLAEAKATQRHIITQQDQVDMDRRIREEIEAAALKHQRVEAVPIVRSEKMLLAAAMRQKAAAISGPLSSQDASHSAQRLYSSTTVAAQVCCCCRLLVCRRVLTLVSCRLEWNQQRKSAFQPGTSNTAPTTRLSRPALVRIESTAFLTPLGRVAHVPSPRGGPLHDPCASGSSVHSDCVKRVRLKSEFHSHPKMLLATGVVHSSSRHNVAQQQRMIHQSNHGRYFFLTFSPTTVPTIAAITIATISKPMICRKHQALVTTTRQKIHAFILFTLPRAFF